MTKYTRLWAAGPALAGVLLGPHLALAHPGRPPGPHDLATAWSAEPQVLLPLLGVIALYAAGTVRVWGRTGVGRGVGVWQAAAFAGGWLALYLALISPLDALSDALFSAHMAQHLLLILVAAPLLVVAQPLAALTWGLPLALSQRMARSWHKRPVLRRLSVWIAAPLFAWFIHAVTITVWHVPVLYEWALADDLAHALEHVAFLGSALLFWGALFHGRGRASSYGASALYVFAMALVSTLLGALITFAPEPWYSSYSETTAVWGLSALADQQLAGAIMWVPAGVVYLGTALALLVAWLRAVEARVTAREARDAAAAPEPGQASRFAGEGKGAP
jgi:putative membrane protein